MQTFNHSGLGTPEWNSLLVLLVFFLFLWETPAWRSWHMQCISSRASTLALTNKFSTRFMGKKPSPKPAQSPLNWHKKKYFHLNINKRHIKWRGCGLCLERERETNLKNVQMHVLLQIFENATYEGASGWLPDGGVTKRWAKTRAGGGVALFAPASSGDQNKNRQVYGAEINLKESFSFRLNIQSGKTNERQSEWDNVAGDYGVSQLGDTLVALFLRSLRFWGRKINLIYCCRSKVKAVFTLHCNLLGATTKTR